MNDFNIFDLTGLTNINNQSQEPEYNANKLHGVPIDPDLDMVQVGNLLEFDGEKWTFATGTDNNDASFLRGTCIDPSLGVEVTTNGGVLFYNTVDEEWQASNSGNVNSLNLQVNHDTLVNYEADQHIDHSTVSINTGTGLTGGGNITSSRTLALTNTGVGNGTYGSANQSPQLTVDQQGRITTATDIDINHNTLLNYETNQHIDWTSTTEDFLTTGTVTTGDTVLGGDVLVQPILGDTKVSISSSNTNIQNTLTYTGSTPTAGEYLQTDASGNASWAEGSIPNVTSLPIIQDIPQVSNSEFSYMFTSSGTLNVDSSGNNRTAVLDNVTFSSNVSDGSYVRDTVCNFPTASSKLNLASHISTINSFENFCFSAWVRFPTTPSSGLYQLFRIGNISNSSRLTITYSDRITLNLSVDAVPVIVSELIIDLDTNQDWNHIFYQTGVNGNSLYINGTKRTLVYSSGNATSTESIKYLADNTSQLLTEAVIAGNTGSPSLFNMDSVEIFDKVLTSAEIAKLSTRSGSRVTIEGDLEVVGSSTFSGDTTIEGDLEVVGSSTLSGDTTIQGKLSLRDGDLNTDEPSIEWANGLKLYSDTTGFRIKSESITDNHNLLNFITKSSFGDRQFSIQAPEVADITSPYIFQTENTYLFNIDNFNKLNIRDTQVESYVDIVAPSFYAIDVQITSQSGTFRVPNVHTKTTTSGANIQVDSNGFIRRSTSGRKYKKDIQDLVSETDFDIFAFKPRKYKSNVLLNDGDDPNQVFYGLVADEVATVNPALATYDADGQPDGVDYQAFIPFLIAEIQELKRKIKK